LVIEELVVQPWSLPKQIALAIFHLLAPDYRSNKQKLKDGAPKGTILELF